MLLRGCCIITDRFLIVNSCIIDVAQPIIDKPHVVVSFRELLLIQYEMRVARVFFGDLLEVVEGLAQVSAKVQHGHAEIGFDVVLVQVKGLLVEMENLAERGVGA